MAKKIKHEVICEECMTSSGTKELTEYDYYWVNRGMSNSLYCIKCVEKYDKIIHKPYKIKTVRKKKE